VVDIVFFLETIAALKSYNFPFSSYTQAHVDYLEFETWKKLQKQKKSTYDWMKVEHDIGTKSMKIVPDHVMAFQPIWELLPAQMLPLPPIFRTILVTLPGSCFKSSNNKTSLITLDFMRILVMGFVQMSSADCQARLLRSFPDG
jgi:hypothetical protein